MPVKEDLFYKEFHGLCKFLVDRIDYEDESAMEKTFSLFQGSYMKSYNMPELKRRRKKRVLPFRKRNKRKEFDDLIFEADE